MLGAGRTLWWHRLWGPALAVAVLILLDPGKARAEPGVPVPPGELLGDRNTGEVFDADRDFVVKVRLAGLWEIPAGEMAQKKSTDPRIQEIGRTIAAQHVVLDKLDRAAAKKLGISLPGKPNSDQQGWLGEMRDAEGADFDQIYIDRLRAAHGKIFPAIATIRTSTRNDTVRKLAQQANQFVMTHLTLLESSGLVEYQALPTAPAPSATAGPQPQALPAKAQTLPASRATTALALVVLAAVLGGVVFAVRRAGTRRRPPREYTEWRPDY